MLSGIYETLVKIRTGIKHRALIFVAEHELGLEIRSEITCTLNKQKYYLSRVITLQEMHNGDGSYVIDQFIATANDQFRLAYESAETSKADTPLTHHP